MIDFEKQFGNLESPATTRQSAVATTFKLVYGWMCAALALSGVIAWYTAESGLCLRILQNRGMMILCILELALVFGLSAAIRKLSLFAAYAMFFAYAAVNGLTLSVVFVAFEAELVQKVFFVTAGMFGGLALWGTFTKGNLSSIGHVCGMALWGLLIALVVNMIWPSSGLDTLITFAGIAIFSGLTMYDANKIKLMAAEEAQLDGETLHKVSIMGALTLYLDFVNLFLYLLRFFSRSRD